MMISIALATYNGEKFIKEQIDSIIYQTFEDWELVISDDCSNDRTIEILHEYEKKDKRIHVFCNQVNVGFKDNFAKAISYCKGEYIALADQDDVWTNDHIELLYKNIGNNSLICSNSTVVDENLNRLGYQLHNDTLFVADNKESQFIQLIYSNFVQGCTVLFKKELMKDFIPIPKNQRYHDYWLAWVAVTKNGIKYIDQSTLFYRQHFSNITDNSRTNIIKRIRNIIKQRNEFQNNIIWADDVFRLSISEVQEKELKKGLDFLKSYDNIFKRWIYIPYYIKYYKLIHSQNNYKDFIFRFIKRFVLFR